VGEFSKLAINPALTFEYMLYPKNTTSKPNVETKGPNKISMGQINVKKTSI
jgi:hypothetical protein